MNLQQRNMHILFGCYAKSIIPTKCKSMFIDYIVNNLNELIVRVRLESIEV